MQEIPTPTRAPLAPGAPASPIVQVYTGQSGASASAIYEGLKAQRRELESQLDNLQDRRRDLSEQLQDPMVGGADRKGLEQRISELDGRISMIDQQIAESEMRIAQAAGVPGAVVERPEPRPQGPPEEVFVLAGIFMFVVVLPLVIAYARRIWRRGAATVAAIPQEIYDRFNRLDQAVDSVAIEVERIGEGQRFLTRLHAERGLGAGAAERIEVPEREPQRQKLK